MLIENSCQESHKENQGMLFFFDGGLPPSLLGIIYHLWMCVPRWLIFKGHSLRTWEYKPEGKTDIELIVTFSQSVYPTNHTTVGETQNSTCRLKIQNKVKFIHDFSPHNLEYLMPRCVELQYCKPEIHMSLWSRIFKNPFAQTILMIKYCVLS